MRTKHAESAIFMVAGGLLTVLVGWSRAGDESFWFDEAATAQVVDRSLGGLIRVLWDQEAGMTSYYIGLWMWSQAADSDFWLRAFSVLGGAVCVAVTAHLASRRAGWFGGVLAIGLMVSHPFFLRHLTEARTYAWTMAVAVIALWAADRARAVDTARSYATAGAVTGAGIASHLLFALFVPILGVAALVCSVRLRAKSVAWYLACTAVVSVLALPSAISRQSQLDWLTSQRWQAYLAQFEGFIGGWFGVVFGVGLVLALFEVRRRPGPAQFILVAASLGAFTFPLLVLALSSIRFVFLARYLAPGFPCLVLATSIGIAGSIGQVAHQQVRFAVTSLMLFGMGATFILANPFVEDGRGPGVAEAVEHLTDVRRPGETVLILHHPTAVLHFLGYQPALDPAALPELDGTLAHPRRPTEQYLPAFAESERFFVLYWKGWPVEAEVNRLLETRTVEIAGEFGDTVLLEVE